MSITYRIRNIWDKASYSWSSTGGGTFSPNTTVSSVLFTRPTVTRAKTIWVRCLVTYTGTGETAKKDSEISRLLQRRMRVRPA